MAYEEYTKLEMAYSQDLLDGKTIELSHFRYRMEECPKEEEEKYHGFSPQFRIYKIFKESGYEYVTQVLRKDLEEIAAVIRRHHCPRCGSPYSDNGGDFALYHNGDYKHDTLHVNACEDCNLFSEAGEMEARCYYSLNAYISFTSDKWHPEDAHDA